MTIISPLILQPLPDRKWKLAVPFVVITETLGQVTVPEGFECDLSSIPRFLWWESTPADYPEAGVLHDWAYDGNRYPRATADKLYAEVLKFGGASTFRQKVRYWGLRAFGWHAYKNDATPRATLQSP